MKKLVTPAFGLLFLLASFSSFACERYSLWLETPVIGTSQENQQLFKKILSEVSASLEAKNYRLIPYGTYTQDLTKKNFCEINVEVIISNRSKFKANVRIEEFEYDMSEVIFQAEGDYNHILKSIPTSPL